MRVFYNISSLFVCKTLLSLFFSLHCKYVRFHRAQANEYRLTHSKARNTYERIQKQLGVRGATGVLREGIGIEVVGRRAIGFFFVLLVELFHL